MENNQSSKPISFILEELKAKFNEVVTTSNVHISLVELVLKDVFADVQYSSKLQAQYEKEQYENSITENQESTKE